VAVTLILRMSRVPSWTPQAAYTSIIFINGFHQNEWSQIKVNCLWSPVINYSQDHTTGVKYF